VHSPQPRRAAPWRLTALPHYANPVPNRLTSAQLARLLVKPAHSPSEAAGRCAMLCSAVYWKRDVEIPLSMAFRWNSDVERGRRMWLNLKSQIAAKVFRNATKAQSVPVTAPPRQSYCHQRDFRLQSRLTQLWNSSTVREAAMREAPSRGAIVKIIFQYAGRWSLIHLSWALR